MNAALMSGWYSLMTSIANCIAPIRSLSLLRLLVVEIGAFYDGACCCLLHVLWKVAQDLYRGFHDLARARGC
jgi:hypothetical protein